MYQKKRSRKRGEAYETVLETVQGELEAPVDDSEDIVVRVAGHTDWESDSVFQVLQMM